ncbi:hypothetical protein PAMP_001866 [Pampus punctatissimus]
MKGEKDNVGIVELKGPITVPVTVVATNKRSFRDDLPRLRQTTTERHKNIPQPLTEHTCLETAFQSGYLVKCRRALQSHCPQDLLNLGTLSQTLEERERSAGREGGIRAPLMPLHLSREGI